ncbi:MAG: hypothetical protein ACLFS3_01125 [Candidatus Aenigmatarchaeota archaeon]
MTQKTKRVPVSKEIWQDLGRMKEAGETYDELLKKMIRDYQRHKLAEKAREARKGKGKWIKLDD